ncbi:MAG: hypothetical protein RLZ35_244 [Pseudomonadota bacterium]
MRGRHKSLDKHLKNEIAWVEKLPGVQKIVLGFSESCRHRYPPGHIRFTADVDGGIKVIGYSGKGVTDIFIRIDPPEAREIIKLRMAERFSLG